MRWDFSWLKVVTGSDGELRCYAVSYHTRYNSLGRGYDTVQKLETRPWTAEELLVL